MQETAESQHSSIVIRSDVSPVGTPAFANSSLRDFFTPLPLETLFRPPVDDVIESSSNISDNGQNNMLPEEINSRGDFDLSVLIMDSFDHVQQQQPEQVPKKASFGAAEESIDAIPSRFIRMSSPIVSQGSSFYEQHLPAQEKTPMNRKLPLPDSVEVTPMPKPFRFEFHPPSNSHQVQTQESDEDNNKKSQLKAYDTLTRSRLSQLVEELDEMDNRLDQPQSDQHSASEEDLDEAENMVNVKRMKMSESFFIDEAQNPSEPDSHPQSPEQQSSEHSDQEWSATVSEDRVTVQRADSPPTLSFVRARFESATNYKFHLDEERSKNFSVSNHLTFSSTDGDEDDVVEDGESEAGTEGLDTVLENEKKRQIEEKIGQMKQLAAAQVTNDYDKTVDTVRTVDLLTYRPRLPRFTTPNDSVLSATAQQQPNTDETELNDLTVLEDAFDVVLKLGEKDRTTGLGDNCAADESMLNLKRALKDLIEIRADLTLPLPVIGEEPSREHSNSEQECDNGRAESPIQAKSHLKHVLSKLYHHLDATPEFPLTSLHDLNLSACPTLESLYDLSTLAPTLKKVNVSGTQVRGFGGLPCSVENVVARECRGVDVGSLFYLTELRRVDLTVSRFEIDAAGNGATGMSFNDLKGLGRLEEVVVDGRSVSGDLRDVGESVKRLSARGCGLTNAQIISGNWKKLEYVDLIANQLTSFELAADTVTNLKTIQLDRNPLKRIKLVSKTVANLSVKSTREDTRIHLGPLPSLKRLHLADLPLSQSSIALLMQALMAPSNVAPNLQDLMLRRISLRAIPPLSINNGLDLPGLRSLDIRENELTSISSLIPKGTRNDTLDRVDLAGNELGDLASVCAVLKRIRRLQCVSVAGNGFSAKFPVLGFGEGHSMNSEESRGGRENGGGNGNDVSLESFDTLSTSVSQSTSGSGGATLDVRSMMNDVTYVRRVMYLNSLMRVCPTLKQIDGQLFDSKAKERLKKQYAHLKEVLSKKNTTSTAKNYQVEMEQEVVRPPPKLKVKPILSKSSKTATSASVPHSQSAGSTMTKKSKSVAFWVPATQPDRPRPAIPKFQKLDVIRPPPRPRPSSPPPKRVLLSRSMPQNSTSKYYVYGEDGRPMMLSRDNY